MHFHTLRWDFGHVSVSKFLEQHRYACLDRGDLRLMQCGAGQWPGGSRLCPKWMISSVTQCFVQFPQKFSAAESYPCNGVKSWITTTRCNHILYSCPCRSQKGSKQSLEMKECIILMMVRVQNLGGWHGAENRGDSLSGLPQHVVGVLALDLSCFGQANQHSKLPCSSKDESHGWEATSIRSVKSNKMIDSGLAMNTSTHKASHCRMAINCPMKKF